MILAIETSDILCSVAFRENGRILAEYNHELPMQHAMLVAELVGQGLAFLSADTRKQKYTVDDINLVAIAIGPGSFTGLRIGLSYVQGFCFGRQIPVTGISNHQVLALQCHAGSEAVFTVIEARRNEIYLGEHEFMDGKFPRLKQHRIVHKKELANHLPENSQVIWKHDFDATAVNWDDLKQKGVGVYPHGMYSGGCVAELAQMKTELFGPDRLEDLEPMYIRPFAGVQ